MKVKIDAGIVEFDENELYETESDVERKRRQEEFEKEMTDMKEGMEESESKEMEDAPLDDSVERSVTALEILECEKALQQEREEMWIKEKKHKRMVRTVKTVVLLAIVAILVIAYFAGYRIPIPESLMVHIQGIYNTAFDAVIGFFTNH